MNIQYSGPSLINTMLRGKKKKGKNVLDYVYIVCIYSQYCVFIIVSIKTTHPLITNALLRVTYFLSIK